MTAVSVMQKIDRKPIVRADVQWGRRGWGAAALGVLGVAPARAPARCPGGSRVLIRPPLPAPLALWAEAWGFLGLGSWAPSLMRQWHLGLSVFGGPCE